MRTWRSRSAAETREVGTQLAKELVPDGCLLLEGPLGAGKTVLVQGLAAGLGIEESEVQSPTFTLLRVHEAKDSRLLHFDLYRLQPEEVAAEGFEELLAGPGVKAVEWAERLPFDLPGAIRLVLVEGDREGERTIHEQEPGPAAEAGDREGSTSRGGA